MSLTALVYFVGVLSTTGVVPFLLGVVAFSVWVGLKAYRAGFFKKEEQQTYHSDVVDTSVREGNYKLARNWGANEKGNKIRVWHTSKYDSTFHYKNETKDTEGSSRKVESFLQAMIPESSKQPEQEKVKEEPKKIAPTSKLWIVLGVLCWLYAALMPDAKTSKLLVGAYVADQMLGSEVVQDGAKEMYNSVLESITKKEPAVIVADPATEVSPVSTGLVQTEEALTATESITDTSKIPASLSESLPDDAKEILDTVQTLSVTGTTDKIIEVIEAGDKITKAIEKATGS